VEKSAARSAFVIERSERLQAHEPFWSQPAQSDLSASLLPVIIRPILSRHPDHRRSDVAASDCAPGAIFADDDGELRVRDGLSCLFVGS